MDVCDIYWLRIVQAAKKEIIFCRQLLAKSTELKKTEKKGLTKSAESVIIQKLSDGAEGFGSARKSLKTVWKNT